MLTTGKGVIDRQAYWNKLKTDGWGILYSEPDYRQRFQKFFVDTLLIQGVVEQYVKLNHQNDQGIFLLHIPGRNNARDLPELSKNFSDLAVTGAFYGDVFFEDRAKAVTYIATLDPNGPLMYKEALKSIPSIFAHEVGHAIFLPHAPTVNLGSGDPLRTKEGCHVKGDNCLMNYDVDSEHFCGVCMLRMRGWDWQPLPNTLGEQEYQLTVEIDDVDTLFSAPVTSPDGVKERLQVMGMLNRPLNHPEIDPCLNFSWDHFDEVVLHSAVSLNELYNNQCVAALLSFLKDTVKEFLVDGGRLPAAGNFAKIRAPGGFAAMYSQNFLLASMWQHEGQPAAKPYEDFMLGADRFQAENAFYSANPALGKIALKATVRRRVKGSNDPWTLMARQARVYFQLVTPDDIAGAPVGPPGFVDVAGGKTFQTGVKAPPLKATPRSPTIKRK